MTDQGSADGWSTALPPAEERGEPADASTTADPEPKKRSAVASVAAFFAELPLLVLIAFILALLLKTFVVQAFFIPSTSMVPTLERGDRILVNKLVHIVREPQRGEVVVFAQDGTGPGVPQDAGLIERFLTSVAVGLGLAAPDETDFVKRIVGMPGETIEVRDGVVFIDGEEIPETISAEGGYLAARDRSQFGPLDLGSDEYFMMGDNRPSSLDSRSDLGTIHRDEIVGRAFVIIWPGNRFSRLAIPDYPAGAAGEIDARQSAESP